MGTTAAPETQPAALKRMDRVLRQLDDLLELHYDEDFQHDVMEDFEELGEKIENDFWKKYDKCNWGPAEMEDDETERERADMDDPCVGAKQLANSLSRVAKAGKPAKFANRIDSKAKKLARKMTRKARCGK